MLAAKYTQDGKPMEWFEELYRQAMEGEAIVPWADLRANPNLVEWLENYQVEGKGKTALKVGCGLGDDVEELCQRGFKTIGFDISASAIQWCQNRFPESLAEYVVADLFHPSPQWYQGFDFVLETYTIQALPPSRHRSAIAQIANFVAPQGKLLLICRGREEQEDPGQLPYPLTQAEVMGFVECGLSLERFEDYLDESESPPVRRFRVTFTRNN
ncbi:thiopurine S-methyltransferase [Calothrix sp. 336/3]|nr:thiopurine S-methyltransferase [Calothrix sp. 336/3]